MKSKYLVSCWTDECYNSNAYQYHCIAAVTRLPYEFKGFTLVM